MDVGLQITDNVNVMSRLTISLPIGILSALLFAVSFYLSLYIVIIPICFIFNSFNTQFEIKMLKIKNHIYNADSIDPEDYQFKVLQKVK